jgi:hypothetical protein
MSYLVTDPKPVETDISCKGCGADLLVTTGWEEAGMDEDAYAMTYEPVFISVSCSSNKEYGCICVDEKNLACLHPAHLLEEIEDSWTAESERRMEMYY